MFGMPSNILTGIDFYDATFHQNRGAFNGAPPIHMYDLSQQTFAAYWQQTIGILPTTDFSYGARIQNISLTARDRYDPNAPDCAISLIATPKPCRSTAGETQHALHIGLEHRFNNVFSVFGRAARAFRTPECRRAGRIGTAFEPRLLHSDPRQLRAEDADLATTSKAAFASRPARSRCNPASTTWTSKTRSISIRSAFFNYNLDPTRRYGSETSATFRASDTAAAPRRLRLYPRGIPRGPVHGQ